MPRTLSRREWWATIALLLIAFALRAIDLTRVPPGLHNDEVIETRIAETVVDGRLAIFFPEDTGSEGLHYYVAALFIRLFGNTVFALRLPAVFLSLIGACVIWALARRLFGPIAALTALAGFAISFWTVAFGRIVSHVTVEVPVAALAAYCFGRAEWRARSATDRRAWALWALSGLWLGLSIYAYTAARILPAIFVAYGAYAWIAHRAEWRRKHAKRERTLSLSKRKSKEACGLALALAMAAVVTLPLIVYLIQNPTVDDLGFFEIDRPLTELRRGNLAPVIETALNTLGMFAFVGDPLPYYDVPGRPIFEPIGALLLAAGLSIALWRWRRPEHAFVVMWFFLSLVPGMLSQPAPNYTRTIGVQVVLFAIPGIAVDALLRRARGAIVYAGLAIVFGGNLAWTAHDYFTVWPSVDTVRFWHHSGLKAVADRLQADPDTSPVVLCAREELIDERLPWWKPAWQHMRYLLHRPDLSIRYYNCVDTLVLVDGPARYAVPDADADMLGTFPVYSQFLAAASLNLDVLPERLGVILHADVTAHRRVRAALDQHLAEVAASSVVAWAPEAGGGPAQLPISFGGQVEFLGYTLSPDGNDLLHPSSLTRSVHPSSAFDLTTYWRVTGALPPQLSQFTHVLNADGAIVAQQDRLALTSASLRVGDIFAQIHRVTLPGNLAEGEYALAIGLYTPQDGVRLRIEQEGQPRGERLWLRSITLSQARSPRCAAR